MIWRQAARLLAMGYRIPFDMGDVVAWIKSALEETRGGKEVAIGTKIRAFLLGAAGGVTAIPPPRPEGILARAQTPEHLPQLFLALRRQVQAHPATPALLREALDAGAPERVGEALLAHPDALAALSPAVLLAFYFGEEQGRTRGAPPRAGVRTDQGDYWYDLERGEIQEDTPQNLRPVLQAWALGLILGAGSS